MALEVTFTITDRQETIIRNLAANAGVTPRDYVMDIITGFINKRVKDYYIRRFNSLTLQEMVDIFGEVTN